MLLVSNSKKVRWEDPYIYNFGEDGSTCNQAHIFFWGLVPVTSLVDQTIKHLPAMWEIWVWSLGQEDPLEKGMATHPSILAWRIPWTEEPGGLPSRGLQRVGHDWVTNTHTTEDKSFSSTGRLEFKPKTHHLSSNHLTSPNLRPSSMKWTGIIPTILIECPAWARGCSEQWMK